jgi:hypothetical protein
VWIKDMQSTAGQPVPPQDQMVGQQEKLAFDPARAGTLREDQCSHHILLDGPAE